MHDIGVVNLISIMMNYAYLDSAFFLSRIFLQLEDSLCPKKHELFTGAALGIRLVSSLSINRPELHMSLGQ